jgi:hypothetical protein
MRGWGRVLTVKVGNRGASSRRQCSVEAYLCAVTGGGERPCGTGARQGCIHVVSATVMVRPQALEQRQ